MLKAVILQAVATLIAVLLAGALFGVPGAISAAGAGVACVLPSWLFAMRLSAMARRTGTATVTALQKSNFAGIPGKLTLTALSVTAADGGQVPLTGLTYSEGENKMVVSIALAFVCLLTLLIKGGPAMPPVGTQFNATVASPVEITVS